MKKRYLLIILAALLLFGCKPDEIVPEDSNKSLVDTKPTNRAVVLEEISGVLCWWTPTGHKISKTIYEANPDKVILVSIHASSYAGPTKDWPNYTTVQGKAIYTQAGITAIPSATVNRMKCSDLGVNPWSVNTPISMDRSYWATAVTNALKLSAPVNIGAKASFDSNTRILTLKVELYYTEGDTSSNNINVFLLQDHVIGKQKDNSGTITDYEQNNVFRDMLTPGNWGETISEPTTKDSRITRTYTYSVPSFYNGSAADGGGAVVVDDLKIVAFVSRGQLEILNAVKVDVQ